MAIYGSSSPSSGGCAETSKKRRRPSSASVASPESPRVPVVRGRSCDSERRKFCHQCRQKRTDTVVSCRQMKKTSKPCVMKFCSTCLANRYGEEAEEAMALENWSCPRCRGICNCSVCRKKNGQKPTGILVHTAKATGFPSVFELLKNKGSQVLDAANEYKNMGRIISSVSEKGLGAPKRGRGKKNNVEEMDTEPMIVNDDKKLKRDYSISIEIQEPVAEKMDDAEVEPSLSMGKNERLVDSKVESCSNHYGRNLYLSKYIDKGIVLPQSTPEGIDVGLQAEDLKHALQFLEFCNTFSKRSMDEMPFGQSPFSWKGMIMYIGNRKDIAF